MSEFTTVDYLSQALTRATTPFNNDVLFEDILTLLLQEPQLLQEVLGEVKLASSIDTAYGDALDIIGLIVGQERTLPANAGDIGLLTYFGFDGAENAESFGDLDDSDVGANFIDQTQIDGGIVTLSDEAYRFFIRAKIIANTTAVTPNEIMEAAAFLFGIDTVTYSEGNASITLGLGITDDDSSFSESGIDIQAVAYDYIPKPAGIQISYLYNYDPNNVFGFEGDVGSQGFGDLDDPDTGGSFAEIF